MGARTASPLPSRRLPARCLVGGVRRHLSVRQMGSTELPVYLEGGRGTLRAVDAAAKNAEARHEDLVRSAELPVLTRSRIRAVSLEVTPGSTPVDVGLSTHSGATPPRSRAGVPPGRSLRPLSRSRRHVGRRGARRARSLRRCRSATTGLSRALPVPLSGLCCHGSSFHPRRGPPGEPVAVRVAMKRARTRACWARMTSAVSSPIGRW